MVSFRCYNCVNAKGLPGKDFEAEATKPTCPACGLNGLDARFKHYIVLLETIHFDPPHPVVKNMGCGVMACGIPERGRFTGEPLVVNCPACRATEVWKKAVAATPELALAHAEFDYALNANNTRE